MFPRATRFRAEELFRCPSRRAWDRVIERHARTRFSWQAFSSIHAPPFLLRLETAIDWAATANPSAIRSIWPANVALDGWTDRLLPSNTKKLTSRFYSNPLPSARLSGHDLFARPYGNTPCSRLETQIFHWLLDFVLMFVTKMSEEEEGRGDSLRETVWNNVVGGVIKRRVSFSLI